MKNKQRIGTIKGTQLITETRGKLNRNDGQVKSGTGYHRSAKDYNRKGKEGQRLKNRMKDYGSGPLSYFIRACPAKLVQRIINNQ